MTSLGARCLHPHLQMSKGGAERFRDLPRRAQVGGSQARLEPLSHYKALLTRSSCLFPNSFWVAIKNRTKYLTTQWSPALRLGWRQHEGIRSEDAQWIHKLHNKHLFPNFLFPSLLFPSPFFSSSLFSPSPLPSSFPSSPSSPPLPFPPPLLPLLPSPSLLLPSLLLSFSLLPFPLSLSVFVCVSLLICFSVSLCHCLYLFLFFLSFHCVLD